MYSQYNWNKLTIPKHTHKNIVENNSMRKQRGTVLVFVVLTLITIFSFAALAIDVGYLFVVRNQLQNAADAAALTLASHLYPLNGTQPNWAAAGMYELAAIYMNKAEGKPLVTGNVEYGYWDVTTSSSSWKTLPYTPVSNQPAAVKVIIRKTDGQNGGGVATVFARILGINTLDAGATAVAVLASPGYTKESLFPVALSGCIFGLGSGGTGTVTPPIGPFTSDSPYGPLSSNCYTSQWTPLNGPSNSDKVVQDLIAEAAGDVVSSSTLSITNPPTPLFMQNGTEANLYKLTDKCSSAGNGDCAYEVMPVVCPSSGSCNTGELAGQTQNIIAFVCIQIISAVSTGKTKSITMEVVPQSNPNYLKNCKIGNSGGVGPSYGTPIPPKLVNYSGNTY